MLPFRSFSNIFKREFSRCIRNEKLKGKNPGSVLYGELNFCSFWITKLLDLNLEPEDPAASVVQQNATRREAQDMGRILQRLLKEGTLLFSTPYLHLLMTNNWRPFVICSSTLHQVTSSRTQRRFICDWNPVFGKSQVYLSLVNIFNLLPRAYKKERFSIVHIVS